MASALDTAAVVDITLIYTTPHLHPYKLKHTQTHTHTHTHTNTHLSLTRTDGERS